MRYLNFHFFLDPYIVLARFIPEGYSMSAR